MEFRRTGSNERTGTGRVWRRSSALCEFGVRERCSEFKHLFIMVSDKGSFELQIAASMRAKMALASRLEAYSSQCLFVFCNFLFFLPRFSIRDGEIKTPVWFDGKTEGNGVGVVWPVGN